ncbi:MAG TPA: serine/threonine-protein kinase [Kofleriaceae bacterium]|jgi:serine/threonine-protein kinase|nr:serine/threonine-protein kinase [Kofleriaceae bacterium]
MEGTIIGQYRIVQKIGAGGMGVVYVAEHTLVGRRAAIKVLLPEYSVRRALVTRFFNEARAMTSIPDPGIVQMYDFGFHGDGSAYIVMELLEGETLERRLQRLVRLALIDAVRLTRQIAGSLAAAHAAGIIHRDLKPENIFVVRDPEALGGERPKVLDFGVAKLSGDLEQGQTLAGAVMGTPAYMSPEQCRGAGAVDARTDIYSLGCVLAQLVTGHLPFDGTGVGELISAHMNQAPRRPSEVAPELPAELDELVLRCLAKSPDARFPTMLALQAACDALLARLSLGDGSVAGALSAMRSGARSVIPARDVVAISSHPTTLSSAAGVTNPSVAGQGRRRGVWIGLAAAVVVVAIAAVIAVSGGGGELAPRGGTPAAAAPGTPSAIAPVTAPSAAPGTASVAASGTAPDTTSGAGAAGSAAAPAASHAGVSVGADRPGRDAAASAATGSASPAHAATVPTVAPPAKSRPRPRPRRAAPERPEDLYDDR